MLFVELSTPSEICQQLGQRLRAQRLAQLLSQAELAARAGVALGTLRKLESTGQTFIETLVRVAQTLGLAAPLLELWPPQALQSIAQLGFSGSRRALLSIRSPSMHYPFDSQNQPEEK
ncbi:DNA-binding protein [Vitreoscilla filiformis]|uniref:DNA-binding protein n=1 Tax=Vitreoscilla filiformis TaxID=63 RepID=A0A221KFP5_VITFI|nr:helix-turn-helix transcriptional regulator [Vitreoscilla filiformis]ASM77872.1 DNA-binding protein [Vitreoscilla filiformis]